MYACENTFATTALAPTSRWSMCRMARSASSRVDITTNPNPAFRSSGWGQAGGHHHKTKACICSSGDRHATIISVALPGWVQVALLPACPPPPPSCQCMQQAAQQAIASACVARNPQMGLKLQAHSQLQTHAPSLSRAAWPFDGKHIRTIGTGVGQPTLKGAHLATPRSAGCAPHGTRTPCRTC